MVLGGEAFASELGTPVALSELMWFAQNGRQEVDSRVFWYISDHFGRENGKSTTLVVTTITRQLWL